MLPVLNEQVVTYAILAGFALELHIRQTSHFLERIIFILTYKGYQISQFDKPICEGGHLDIVFNDKSKRIGITRIHMEEDGEIVASRF